MFRTITWGAAVVAASLFNPSADARAPLGTEFTYQGELRLNNVVVDQSTDFVFDVFGQAAAGASLGTDNHNAVSVSRGVFTVDLDFGAGVFTGDERWLEIQVRAPSGVGGFTTLAPRVKLTATPNAQFAAKAGNATTATTAANAANATLAANSTLFGGNAVSAFVLKGEANSVTGSMIVDGSVSAADLASNSVGAAEIAANAVGASEIATNAVGSSEIAASAVGNSELSNNSITTSKIVDGTVTSADIGTNAVGAAEIAANAVGASELASNAVASAEILDGSVTAADLAVGAIDGGDAETVDGLNSTAFLRSDISDTITGGSTWSVAGGAPNSLTVGGGNLELNLGDSAADQVAVNGSFSTNATVTLGDALTDLATVSGDLDVNDSLDVAGAVTLGDSILDQATVAGTLNVDGPTKVNGGDGLFLIADNAGGISTLFFQDQNEATLSTIRWQESDDRFLVGGGFSILGPVRAGTSFVTTEFSSFGSSTFPSAGEIDDLSDIWVTDAIAAGGNMYIGTASGGSTSSTLFFADPGFGSSLQDAATASFISWDETTASSLSTCTGPTGAITSAMVFNMDDGTSSGWAFTNGTDVEFVVDEIGVVAADNTINALGGCDLAESFLGPDDLEAGTLVRLDPNSPEAILPTHAPYDATMVGVVSTSPAFVMSGPTTDALPMIDELLKTHELLALGGDDELERRAAELEAAVDSWTRGNVDVALVGRVPVLVTGAVKAGEPLTSSTRTGHAMAMKKAGPSIGIALESKSSEGRGTVLVLVQPGWRAPVASSDEQREPVADRADQGDQGVDDATMRAIEERVLARLETRAAFGRDGRDGSDGELGSASSRDGSHETERTDSRDVVRLEKEAWGDFDADGKDDVLVLNPGGAAKMFHNLGDGQFRDVTASANLGETHGARTALWRDVDGDRRLDLLVVGTDGAARLLQGNGAGQFTDATKALGLDFGRPIANVEWIDDDHDGRPDLRVELKDGSLLLHHNLGGLSFETVELRRGIDR